MITIIASWFVFFLIIFQIGRLLLGNKILSILHYKGKVEWYEYFWTGLVGIIAFLQVWSIFLPVNGVCLLLVVGIALSSLALSFLKGQKFPKIRLIKKFVSVNRIFIIVSAFGLAGLAYYSSQPVNYFDTLLYHLNAVKWANSFPVVPGLANLHSRLGFNSSFFLFAAMIDNFILKNASVHIALPLLISVLSVEMVWIFIKTNNIPIKIFVLIVSPFIVRAVIRDGIASSFSPDIALALMVLAVSIEILKYNTKSLFIAGAISVLALTIKLSGIVFFGILFLFAAFEVRKRVKKENLKTTVIMLSMGALLFIPYLIRNVILSGWLLYPAPILKINLPWSLSNKDVIGVYNVIHAWAISPGLNWSHFVNVGILQWLPYWFERNRNALEIKLFIAACIFLMASIVLRINKNKLIMYVKPVVVLSFASFMSIIYFFYTAPDFRFGAIFVWVFFAAAAIPFIILIINKIKPSIVFWSVVWVAFLAVSCWPFAVRGIFLVRSVIKELPYPTKVVLVNQSDPKNQFSMLKPVNEDLCGNSGLPCTPESNPIREIMPGDMSKGFAPVE